METTPQNTTTPDVTPDGTPATSRHYSLWELVRHKDYDEPEPDDTADPADRVLSSPRPSAWPDC